MSVFWQDMGIAAAVMVAFVYLVAYAARRRKRRRPCAQCGILRVGLREGVPPERRPGG
ncbi:MAG TPA: hypothetical protein VMY05_08215 [Acidobacteriota bacterium]|nr:hypothetical protein [Acidobacteriota bacterium]